MQKISANGLLRETVSDATPPSPPWFPAPYILVTEENDILVTDSKQIPHPIR